MGKILSNSMGPPNVDGGKPVVPRLTGIAKARSVGGNAYAKGQNRTPKVSSIRKMGQSMGQKGY